MTDQRLTADEIASRLSGTPWQHEENAIVRELELEDFLAAVAAVNRVAAAAEALNHHPDICIHGWNKLRLTLSTHSAGGVTDADLELAARLDGLL